MTPGNASVRSRGLAPSVISADFAHLTRDLQAVEPFALRWHVDVMDGHYVPNLTIGPSMVRTIAKISTLAQDVHLMIDNPDATWRWYAEAGAARLAFHADTSADAKALLGAIREAGVGPGLAVNPDVDAGAVEPYLEDVDHLVVMSVVPGFSGQKFIPGVLPKLRRLREVVDRGGLNVQLVVDGGVNTETAPACVEAGADVLVSASAVFGAHDPAVVAERLRGIAAGG